MNPLRPVLALLLATALCTPGSRSRALRRLACASRPFERRSTKRATRSSARRRPSVADNTPHRPARRRRHAPTSSTRSTEAPTRLPAPSSVVRGDVLVVERPGRRVRRPTSPTSSRTPARSCTRSRTTCASSRATPRRRTPSPTTPRTWTRTRGATRPGHWTEQYPQREVVVDSRRSRHRRLEEGLHRFRHRRQVPPPR